MTRLSLLAARVLIGAIALAQPLDILTTNRALAAIPGAVESNPAEAFLMLHLGPAWWLPKAGLCLLFLYQALTIRQLNLRTWAILSAAAKVYLFVIISNYFHLF